MPLPGWLARFNRYVTNPIARRFAGWLPGFCILTHVGRKSGREYRLPLNVFEVDGGFVFALTYGSDTDWVENVVAAGGAEMITKGRRVALREPRFLTTEEGMASMPAPVRLILHAIGVTEFLRLDRAD